MRRIVCTLVGRPVGAAAVLALASLPGCGGSGGGGGGGGSAPISGVAPASIPSELPPVLTISGDGLPTSGAVLVRFLADQGTPLLGGTASVVEVPGSADGAGHVVATPNPFGVTGTATARVRVVLPDTTTLDSDAGALTLVGPALTAVSPDPVPTGASTPITVVGARLGPVGAGVSLTFTATAGTPFAGATSASVTVPGTVTAPTQVAAAAPPTPGAPFSATLRVTFPTGAQAALATPVAFGAAGGAGLSVTTDAPAIWPAFLGREAACTVTVASPGHLVSLRLLDAPPGLELAPVVGATSPTTVALRWQVPLGHRVGVTEVVLEGRDDAVPAATTRLVLRADVEPLLGARVVDVTGDGRGDLVAVASQADLPGAIDAGAVYVFAGATTPAGAPTATLTVTGAAATDRLGGGAPPVLVGDVTGDGVADLVVSAPLADAAGQGDLGAIYVWKGGATLVGARAPDATLSVPGGTPGDAIGLRLLADVTGDGVLDVVGGASTVDVAVVDVGALYLWKGGGALVGARAPDASLLPATTAPGDGVGDLVRAVDVSGDGVLDVVTWAPTVDVGGVADVGAVLVWRGGSGLSGTRTADATLAVTGGTANDRLGRAVDEQATDAVRFGDVTGDGVRDVVAVAPDGDRPGLLDVGAAYVFTGGAGLVGTRPPDATLRVPSPIVGDRLGASGLWLVETTADLTLDVVVASRHADSGAADTGALWVFAGGAGLTGTVAPTSTLRALGAVAGASLGGATGHVHVADVSGDGVLDVLALAPGATVGAVVTAGALHLWRGGASPTGVRPADATMTAIAPIAGDQLGRDGALLVGDVSGDGVLDAVVASPWADQGVLADVGAVLVWRGGATMTGAKNEDARLGPAAAVALDALGLGDVAVGGAGTGLALADVSGDGVLDVVARAERADVAAVVDAGSIRVWRGGAGLAGAKTEDALLTVPGAVATDLLGGKVAFGWRVVDVSGDGVADVAATALDAVVAATGPAGRCALWRGGAGLTGARTPDAVLARVAPTAGDRLGQTSFLVGDVGGDGTPDLLLGSATLSPSGAGGVLLWTGAAGLAGTPAPTTTFQVPGAAANDGLGQ
ncbi:MAG: FG-GAP repeat protein [Planctomycetes bacterium]|nr:FG-GAP repeat protein [Planctomycetota bacterium]